MKSYILLLTYTAVAVLSSCSFFEEKKSTIPTNWEMIDIYEDQIDEINEGGYYPLYYNEIREKADSIPPDEEINDNVVAIAIEDNYNIGQSKALVWVADAKQTLLLESNEAVQNKSYHRIYANKDFTVDLNMKFSERIDGLDDMDMLIYKGKMTISQNGTNVSKEFKVKGGI